MKTIKSTIHTIKTPEFVEIETRNELVGLFLVAYSDRILKMSEEKQDRIATMVKSYSNQFMLLAINSHYAKEFKMVEIWLTL